MREPSVDVTVHEGSLVVLDFKHGRGERHLMIRVGGKHVTTVAIKAAGNGCKLFLDPPVRRSDAGEVLHYSIAKVRQ